MKTRLCIICLKELECAVSDWDTNQPSGGGEVIFNFFYGSCKFDDHPWEPTIFRGIICDECAERLIVNMERTDASED